MAAFSTGQNLPSNPMAPRRSVSYPAAIRQKIQIEIAQCCTHKDVHKHFHCFQVKFCGDGQLECAFGVQRCLLVPLPVVSDLKAYNTWHSNDCVPFTNADWSSEMLIEPDLSESTSENIFQSSGSPPAGGPYDLTPAGGP
jgi:hypothetical protein